MTYRPICVIADEIVRDWKNPYFGAAPYLDAMLGIASITDMYGYDSAKSVVSYFLCNATTWKGPVARRVKAELKAMAAGKPVPRTFPQPMPVSNTAVPQE